MCGLSNWVDKCSKGDFFCVPNLLFNNNVYLKFEGVYLYTTEYEK